MKTLVAILFVFSVSSFVHGSPEEKELVITSESMWAVEASAKGAFIEKEESITVLFDAINLARNHSEGRFNGDVFVEGVQVGLATDGEDGWAVKRWGGMLHINKSISVGQRWEFNDFSTVIAVDGIKDLSKYWFVLKVDVEILDGQYGTTYSHSRHGLISPR
jgi:hypothetical protein